MNAINQVSTSKMAAAAVVVSVATTEAAATTAAPLSSASGKTNAPPVDVNVKVYVDGVVTKAKAAVSKELRDLSLEQ